MPHFGYARHDRCAVGRDPIAARVVTPDSVAPRADMGLPVTVVTLAPLLEDVVERLEGDESLGDLISR
jgi:phosphoribosylpyrophosphate synthetase